MPEGCAAAPCAATAPEPLLSSSRHPPCEQALAEAMPVGPGAKWESFAARIATVSSQLAFDV